MGVHLVMLPRLHCEQRLILNRWSQILLGARGFAFSRFRRASAAWRRLGAFALSRETALARENADFSLNLAYRRISNIRSCIFEYSNLFELFELSRSSNLDFCGHPHITLMHRGSSNIGKKRNMVEHSAKTCSLASITLLALLSHYNGVFSHSRSAC
jgi:hypothetical protein